MIKKLSKLIIFVAIAVFVGVTVVYAGSLTLPGSPSATMYTLDDIYTKLTNNTNAGWAAPAASTALQFPAGASNGQIRINTYIDSGRSNLVMLDGGKMAEPGDYATTLVMTVSVQ